MKLTAAAILAFLTAEHSSFAGDLEFNKSLELDPGLQGLLLNDNISRLGPGQKPFGAWLADPAQTIKSVTDIEAIRKSLEKSGISNGYGFNRKLVIDPNDKGVAPGNNILVLDPASLYDEQQKLQIPQAVDFLSRLNDQDKTPPGWNPKEGNYSIVGPCRNCIINPLNPLGDDIPLNLSPRIMAGAQPTETGRQVRELIASGGDDSDLLGCNLTGGGLKEQALKKRPQFSSRQFPEVVKLSIKQDGNDGTVEGCTGTILAEHWALTAAHCITAKWSAKHANNEIGAPNDQDYIFSPPVNDQALKIIADNSALSDVDKTRFADKAIIHKLYDRSGGSNSHDLALLHLAEPFDSTLFPEAALATRFSAKATLAGYGISNTKAPLGTFFVTLPPALIQDGEHLRLDPTFRNGAFCQGDSGGPVYVGFNRGCKAVDLFGEKRPRSVQGVVSYNILRSESGTAEACLASKAMYNQDVTRPDIHDWICKVSDDEINGCKQ